MVRSFRHFNVVIPRRLINLMAGTTLQHTDCVLKSVDLGITEQERVTLRSASFLSDCLFDGKANPVVTRLEASAQDFSLQKSIKTMAAATQQLAKSMHTKKKPSFQGAGTAQVPKTRKPPLEDPSPQNQQVADQTTTVGPVQTRNCHVNGKSRRQALYQRDPFC